MAKLFNKIRQKLVSEKPSAIRTANYLKYAIGEIVLVMMGILLALQVSNWNEQRKNSTKEARVLRQLHLEFIANKAQLQKVVSYHRKAFDAADKILDIIPIDIEQTNLDSLSRYIRRMRYRWTFNPSQGTINTLTSTSSFNVISDIELREMLLQWDDMVKDYTEEEMNSAEFAKNQYSDYLRHHIRIGHKLRRVKSELTFLNSPLFENIIRDRRGFLREIIGEKNDITTELYKVVKTIDKIIELSKTD